MPQPEIFRSVQQRAVAELNFQQLRKINLHIQEEVLKKGHIIHAYQQAIPVPKDTVMVFADDAPRLNWAHPCRYLLYDATNAQKYTEVHAEFPPNLVETPATFRAFHQPVAFAPVVATYIPPIIKWPIRFPVGTRYAVLFAGASNNRHVNDLEFLYRTLVDHYGFVDGNIYVLNYDGTHKYNAGAGAPGATWVDGTPYRMPVRDKGTKAAFDAVFVELKARLKKDDFLLIHANNHGGNAGAGKSYLCTYSGPSYYAADFAATLATLPAFDTLMVMMEQCHAGGFNAPILAHSTAAKTTVASACQEANSSIGGPDFDPFARDWIAGMAGHDPYGHALAFDPDTDHSGKVSAQEAFNYANAIHDPYDTPVYSQSSAAAGQAYLGQRYRYFVWYEALVAKELAKYQATMPKAEFDKKMETLRPRLQEVETKLDKIATDLRTQTEPEVRKLMESAFAARAAGGGGL